MATGNHGHLLIGIGVWWDDHGPLSKLLSPTPAVVVLARVFHFI